MVNFISMENVHLYHVLYLSVKFVILVQIYAVNVSIKVDM